MTHKVSVGILCGGQGTRMGGLDKGLQTISINGSGEIPMVEHLIKCFNPFTKRILLSANRNLDRYSKYSPEVYSDIRSGSLGPLSGLHTLLTKSKHPLLLTSPCDTPFLTSKYVERMLSFSKRIPTEKILVATHEGKLEPLHLVIPKTVLKSIEKALDSNCLSVIEWLKSQAITKVDFSDHPEFFHNINRLTDIQSL